MRSLRVEAVTSLTADQAGHVRRLISISPGAADNPPLSEHAVLHLESNDRVQHILACDSAGQIAGYAQKSDSHSIELVTESGPRSVSVASELVASSRQHAPGASISLWAHGRLSAAEAFAHTEGWRPTRELLQMRRDLGGTEDSMTPADGAITIRAFQPGKDDASWLELNALAFAHHPEQGGWSAADLADRLRSSWFDPAGFLLAQRAGTAELIGFHWTKVHTELTPAIGEVYVLGVHPDAQGQRLGQILLAEGLNHLRRQGLQSVLLYVEGDNVPAVRLYEKQGFSTFSVDIQYSPPSD